MLVDLRPKKATGKAAEKALERAGITFNKNGIPIDPEKPTVTSGMRLGTPAGTTRGFGAAEFRQVGQLIADVLDGLAKNGPDGDAAGRGAGARQGARALRAASRSIATDASARRQQGDENALSVLRSRGHPGEGLATDRGQFGDPPAALLPVVRRALHHLRARAAARADRGQEGRPARAVRPRQARALDLGRLRKRPVDPERVERMVNGIVRRLESSGESEIPSTQIGELVMDALRALDQVAYVRFASVYRNFREAKDFEEFISDLAETTTSKD